MDFFYLFFPNLVPVSASGVALMDFSSAELSKAKFCRLRLNLIRLKEDEETS
jgi:hypothetical protein